nr:hypothetical protein CFP56_50851 [Quercus suber]
MVLRLILLGNTGHRVEKRGNHSETFHRLTELDTDPAQSASNLVAARRTTTIIVILRRNSAYRTRESSIIIGLALKALRADIEDSLPLVQETWDRYKVLVLDLFLDLFHANYSWGNGHIKAKLLVVCVDFFRSSQRISVTSPILWEEVNVGTASHHHLNDWDARPSVYCKPYFGSFPSYVNSRGSCQDNDNSAVHRDIQTSIG